MKLQVLLLDISKKNLHKKLQLQGYIEEFFISAYFRSQGIGTKLYNQLLNHFKKHGCDHLGTDAYFDNILARSFYKKQGLIERVVEFIGEMKE